MSHTLEQLAAFVTAIEAGSFSAAATKLGKSQSAISVLINNLEIELGYTLFDRSTRYPTPTDEANALYKTAVSIVRSSNKFVDRVQAMQVGTDRHLTIAFDEAVIGNRQMAIIMQEFEREFPLTEVLLLNTTLKETRDLVDDGTADIGLLPNQHPDPTYKNYRWIGKFQYVTVTGPGHPLALLDDVEEEDLSQYRRIRISNRTDRYRTNLQDVTDDGWYVDNHNTMKYLLRYGLGWGEMPMHLVETEVRHRELKQLRTNYDRADHFNWTAELTWTEKRPLGIAGQWLIDRFSERDW